ncbi:MAG TPA: ribosome maturation factor RimP [bacterium]|nr:ribosome maturation factor RimP [bacterium]
MVHQVGLEGFFPRFFFVFMDRELASVLQLAEPVAQSMGYEILKGELTSERGDRVLRIYLDRPGGGGFGIDDCQAFSEALGTILDVEAEVSGRYHLEISSPGLDRPLAKPEHFAAQIGKIIQVTTEEPLEGRRHFKGSLLKVEAEGEPAIEIEIDGETHRLPVAAVKKANLDYFASEAKAAGPKPGPRQHKKKKGH